jgi:hypothetical protein
MVAANAQSAGSGSLRRDPHFTGRAQVDLGHLQRSCAQACVKNILIAMFAVLLAGNRLNELLEADIPHSLRPISWRHPCDLLKSIGAHVPRGIMQR